MSSAKWLIPGVVIVAAAMWLLPAFAQDAPKEAPKEAANTPATEPLKEAPKDPPLFEDWSQKFGMDKIDGNQGMVFVDINGDGWPDLVIGGWNIYINEKGQKFTLLPVQKEFLASKQPITKESPAPGPQGALFGDISGSGHLDMYVFFLTDCKRPDFAAKDHGRRNEIWLGDGKGHFTLKKDTGLSSDPQSTGAACLFDYDGDGKLDLFVGNWIEGNGAGESFLYKGNGDGTFTDVTEKAGLKLDAAPNTRKSRRPVFAVTHTDWNNTGLQSLMVGTYAGIWNQLYKNNGDGTFTDVGQATLFDADRAGRMFILGDGNATTGSIGNICTFSLPVADFNCDGNMDVFVSTIRHWDNSRFFDPSQMLINLGPKFDYQFQRDLLRIPRPPAKIMQTNWGDLHSCWIDVDNDGWEDLIIASSDYPDEQLLKLFHQIPDGSGRFEDWTDRLGFKWVRPSNISLADVTRDGATDIVVGRNGMRLEEPEKKIHPMVCGLFHNIAPKLFGNGFFNLRLKGQDIGARVTITTGTHRQIREVYSSIGIGGQNNDRDCRFGVGKAKIIDKVEVRWPDRPNTVQVFEKVEPNRFYTLAKGDKSLTVVDFGK